MTTEELKQLLNALQTKSNEQAPYFDDRILQQIENVKNILKDRGE